MVQKKQKYVSLYGRTSDGLSLVFVRAGPHKGYVTERVQSSVAWCQIAWLHRDRKSGHLNEQLCRKSPRRYFTLTLITSSGIQLIILLYESIWIISHVLWLWSMVRRIIAWFDTERCIVVFSFSFAQILCTTRPPRTAAFFLCCLTELYQCDDRQYHWSKIGQKNIRICRDQNLVHINLSKARCYVSGKAKKAVFLAYGWDRNPWKNNLCAPMYGADEYR